MNEVAKIILILGFIGLVSAVVLSQVCQVTRAPTATAQETEALDAAAQVLQPVMAAGVTVEKRTGIAGKEVIYAAVAGTEVRGVAFIITSEKGYSGPIECMLGLDAAGNIVGFAALQHSETPGQGADFATNQEWQAKLLTRDGQPRNLDNTDWRVKKDGGEIDALTGATITFRAVVSAIREGLEWFRNNRETLLGDTTPALASTEAVEAGGIPEPRLNASRAFPTSAAEATPVITGRDLTE